MVAIETANPEGGLLGTPDWPLTLRVRGPHQAARVVELATAKCTIGSSPRCGLRLAERDVQPVHCLILRGANGTCVRCWAAGATLNGDTFTDAWLRSGDRLHIGPVELQVLDPAEVTSPPEQAGDAAAGQSEPSHDADYQALRQRLEELQEADQQAARLQQAVDELQGRLAEANDELGQAQQQLAEVNDQLVDNREARAAAEAAIDDWKQAAETAKSELERLRQEYEEACQRWNQELAAVQQQRADLQQQVEQRGKQCEQQEARHKELMSEAEGLIYSLQKEGKRLLAQLQEAKQSIRQQAQRIKELETAHGADDEPAPQPDCDQTMRLPMGIGSAAQAESAGDEVGPETELSQTVPVPITSDHPDAAPEPEATKEAAPEPDPGQTMRLPERSDPDAAPEPESIEEAVPKPSPRETMRLPERSDPDAAPEPLFSFETRESSSDADPAPHSDTVDEQLDASVQTPDPDAASDDSAAAADAAPAPAQPEREAAPEPETADTPVEAEATAPDEPARADAPADTPANAPPAGAADASGEVDPDRVAINEYMTQLLSRVCGGQSAEEAAAAASAKAPTAQTPSTAPAKPVFKRSSGAASTSPTSEPPAARTSQQEPPADGARTTDSRIDLSAMRELANDTARGALLVSARNRYLAVLVRQLVLSALLCGGGLVAFCLAGPDHFAFYVGGIFSLTGGLMIAVRAARTLGTVRALGEEAEQGEPEAGGGGE